ncbi:MAG: methyltransferase domain-containing protein [Nanoarchaeota archaeon]|nr:methyltransferase domain-containing protein [Nanoarchaeota archaeon]
MKCLFDLGRDVPLAKEELFSKLDSWNVNYAVIEEFGEVVILDCETDFKKLQNHLGGTVRIVELKSFDELFVDEKEKWGFTSYGLNRTEHAKKLTELKNLLGSKYFKHPSKGGKRVLKLSPMDLVKRIKKEFVFAQGFWGETITFFNPFSHITRDIARPRDKETKSISIRLAKILVNLSFVKKGEVLLDPFCGVGTVLQEALLQGVNVVGVDNSKIMFDNARRNLRWIKKKFGLNTSFNVIHGDSQGLQKLVEDKVNVVVSEPYLGPLITRTRLSLRETLERVHGLQIFYDTLFKGVDRVLLKNGFFVFVLPRFRVGKKIVDIDVKKLVKGKGLKETGFVYEYSKRESRLLRVIRVFRKI